MIGAAQGQKAAEYILNVADDVREEAQTAPEIAFKKAA